MTAKRIIAILLAAIMCLLCSCAFVTVHDGPKKLSSDEGGKREQNPNVSGISFDRLSALARNDDGKRSPDADFIDAMLKSSFEYFSEAVEDGKSSENILVSPLSLYIALAMTACGAEGNTLSQMEQALGGVSADDAARYLAYLEESLSDSERIELEIANSVWIRDDKDMIEVNRDFVEVLEEYFDADSYLADFDERTVKDINGWISDNTDGMIREMLKEIPEEAVMYLINALVFEADWADTYDKMQIWGRSFTEYDGSVKNTELMHSMESQYIKDAEAKGFIKPYKDRRYGFVALLPDEGKDVYEYAASLTGSRFAEILAGAEDAAVDAAMPQFKYEYKDSFVNELKALGMTDAFDSATADLRGIGSSQVGNLYISEILHKTFIEVSPKGTKAGAATVIEVAAEGALEISKDIYEVHLDRPFVYAICDLEYGIPLFVGVLASLD